MNDHLDPSQVKSAAGTWYRDFEVPEEIVKFGYYPDVSKLKPGDLILTSSLNPDWVSSLIRRFQGSEGSEWTHVAMYMGGRGQIVEATFSGILDRDNGVKVGLLSDYFTDHKIMFRRIPDAWLHDPLASPHKSCIESRWQLVVSAMKHMRRPYGFGQLFGFLRKASYLIRIHSARKNLVCSTLYESAVIDATGKILMNGASSVTPAALSSTPALDTVSVPWMKIGRKIPI